MDALVKTVTHWVGSNGTEPATLALIVLGLVCVVILRRRLRAG